MARKPEDYTRDKLFKDLINLPENFIHNGPELIEIRLCPVAMRLAQTMNWPLVRECWRQAYGIHPLSQIRLEPLPCP